MSKISIYLDYNATTPCEPRVVQAMLPYFSDIYGNPANGLHIQGRKAARAIDTARAQVAVLIDAQPNEIVFTSGATESNHLALLGASEYAPAQRRKIITCSIEHKAVLMPCQRLAERGFQVIVLPVDSRGKINLADLELALGPDTFMVSIQAANNEIGTIQSIAEITSLAHKYGALVHSDAAQAIGKIPCTVTSCNVDLLSLSAHKIYGPKGVGALYVRGGSRAIPMRPILEGGGQEYGLRAGTSNVPAIVGLGMACAIALERLAEDLQRLQSYRDEIEMRLQTAIPGLRINGLHAERLPNTTNVTLPVGDADALVMNLTGIMLSTGAACNTGAVEPSHVLQAIGLSREQASASFRISLGRMTSKADIMYTVDTISQAWQSML